MKGKSAGIIYKSRFEPAAREANKLKEWLEARGISVFCEEMETPGLKDRSNSAELHGDVSEDLEWIVVLGGDGTLLGAARQVGRYGVPILGVNLGGLGFMTEIPLKNLYSTVEMMLQGELACDSRLMLEAVVMRGGEEVFRSVVLNDVVLNKSAIARILDLDVHIDDQFLTTFRADGLIVSTPTGSTAYNLSAGGPILYPTLSNIVLTPICPFTLTNRPIILPDTATVKIDLANEIYEEVTLTMDGQVGFDFLMGDRVLIFKSDKRIRLIRSPYKTYFEILRTKLMWGGGTVANGVD
jgi:NAD+ kinase